MGSRAVVVACRDEEAAAKRFGVEGESGIIVTRTGRRFFDDGDVEEALLSRVRAALGAAGFWDEFGTEWAVLDCELMPWSAKALELLKLQYAAVGSAATALPAVVDSLQTARRTLARRARRPCRGIAGGVRGTPRFGAAIRRCLPTVLLVGRIAQRLQARPVSHPGHRKERLHVHQNHRWHMEKLAGVCRTIRSSCSRRLIASST